MSSRVGKTLLPLLLLVVSACGTTTTVSPGQSGGGLAGQTDVGELADGGNAGSQSNGGATTAGGTTAGGTTAGGTTAGGTTAGGRQGVGGGVRTAKGQPIQVGLMIWDNSQIQKALGLSEDENTGPALRRNTARALIKAINKAGGVAGHQLVLIEASVDVTSQDWNSDFEAVCQKFTKDNHVAAVIDDGLFYHQGFNACLTKAGVPQIKLSFGGAGSRIGDITDLQKNPGLIGANIVNVDRKIRSILNKAIAAGFLRSGSKIGIIVEDCPYNLRAYKRTLAPVVARHRISVSRYDVSCAQNGFSEAGPLISNTQSAALRFRSEGADSVMFFTQLEGDLWFYFSQQADSQDWVPQYLMFNFAAGSYSPEEEQSDQTERTRGFGGSPLTDVAKPPAPPPAQAAVRKTCLSMVRSHGVKVTTDEQALVVDVCDGFFLLRAALTNTGGETGLARIVTGIEQLGTGFVSAIDLNGATRYGNGRHDGLDLTAVSVYQSKCKCFAYITPARPIP